MSRIAEKIMQLDEAVSWRKTHTSQSIVFTNGVFDLIHPGHVLYLEEAKSLGDYLIVALNSDASARKLGKGKNRPIVNEMARAKVIAALESVDCVVLFNEETPIEAIRSIMPNILVKGGDYALDQIVGSAEVMAMGGKVLSIPFVDGFSTTNIEQRILESRLSE